jgi:hypothetical protein
MNPQKQTNLLAVRVARITLRRAMQGRFSNPALAALVALVLGASHFNLHAATFSDDNWTGMGGYPGANGPVTATVVDGSGNLYIGGSFNVVGDVPASHIAKWPLKSPKNHLIFMAVSSTGKIRFHW